MNISYIMDADRIKGALYGVMLGDALGLPHERSGRLDSYTGILEIIPVINSRFQGKRTLALGQVSDDTEMMIVLLKCIIENNLEYDVDMVLINYIEWANTCPFIGTNTRDLFKGISTVNGYIKRFRNKFSMEPFSNFTETITDAAIK